MAKDGRRRRNRTKKACKRETALDDLPDHLLERVLVRIDSPLCLIRALFACKRWCRVIADALFRSLDGRSLVLGHYYAVDPRPPNGNAALRHCGPPVGDPTFVPSSPDSFDCRHFALDYLPYGRPRDLVDSRGSLLLFNHGPWGLTWFGCQPFPDLIVCEPLTRRFQGIARLSALGHLINLGTFLINGETTTGAKGGSICMSNYRVVCVVYERGQPRACVFSPGSDGGWRLAWRATDDDPVDLPGGEHVIHFAGRAAGNVYWGTENGHVLVLDESTVEFSTIEFPEHMRWMYKRSNFRVIGGVDGGTVRVVRMTGQDLQLYGQIPESGQWVVEKSVRLADASRELPGREARYFGQPAKIVTADDGFVVLTPEEETWLFSVDLETMELEREHERNKHVGAAYPYALSLQSVLHACLGHGTTRQR